MSTEYNPYSVPTSAIADPVDTQPLEAASEGRRFGTFLIDYVCFVVLSMAIGVLTVLLFGREGGEALRKVPGILLGSIDMLVFYSFFEGIWGRTPGKFILGTVVVNAAGGQPTFGQVLGRTLSRFIPFDAFSFFGEEGWHDSIPKTRVVLTRKR